MSSGQDIVGGRRRRAVPDPCVYARRVIDSPAAPDIVRLALPREARPIAALQRRAWAADLRPEVAAVFAATPVADTELAWERAILQPPLAQFRVLVSLESDRVTGFAAVGPSGDADADPAADGLVAEFAIDPVARGRGHGSRLVNAVADTLRADGFSRATWWVPTDADAIRAFLGVAGWAADGAHRELGAATGVRLKQIRLHCDIRSCAGTG